MVRYVALDLLRALLEARAERGTANHDFAHQRRREWVFVDAGTEPRVNAGKSDRLDREATTFGSPHHRMQEGFVAEVGCLAT